MERGLDMMRRTVTVVAAALAVLRWLPAPAQHRARLSKDLADGACGAHARGAPGHREGRCAPACSRLAAALRPARQEDARCRRGARRLGRPARRRGRRPRRSRTCRSTPRSRARWPSPARPSAPTWSTAASCGRRRLHRPQRRHRRHRLGHRRRATRRRAAAWSVGKDFTGTGLGDSSATARTSPTSSPATDAPAATIGGVAPGARIVSLKVLAGRRQRPDTSDVIRALEWVLRQPPPLQHPRRQHLARPPRVRVVQRRPARAGRAAPHRRGPRRRGLGRQLRQGEDRRQGRARVSAASRRRATCRMSSPWARSTRRAPSAAATMSVATYSSRGPTAIDKVMKPDLVAPGNKVFAAHGGRQHRGRRHARARPGDRADGAPLIAMSGTSVSAGVVSGVVALMLEANPSLRQGAREDGAAAFGAVPARGRARGRVGQPERGRGRVDGGERARARRCRRR